MNNHNPFCEMNSGNFPSSVLSTEKKNRSNGSSPLKNKIQWLRACEEPETENKMRSIIYGIAVVIKLSSGSLTYRSVNFWKVLQKEGLLGLSGSRTRDLSHPKPLDQQAGDVKCGLGRVFYSLLLYKHVD